ncbi:unnamed protein product [Closterium sp. NIES-53]
MLLIACHCFSRPSSPALPVSRAVRLCHGRGPAETSVVTVGAARGTPRTPFFEGCSPSPFAPSLTSAAAVDILGAEDDGAGSASGKRCTSKGKGGTGGGGGSGGSGGAAVELVEEVEVVAVVGVVAGVGALVAAVVAAVGVAVMAEVGVVAVGLELLSVERGASGGSGSCPYVIHTGNRAGQTYGKPHTQQCYFSRLDDAWRAEFGDEAERSHWAELLRSRVAIFDLDYDAILAAMYALSISAEGDCYLCVLPDLGIEAAALGAGESALPGTAPAEALHTFTLDSGASRCFFRDSTTLTPLCAPVLVRLADPSGGPVLARSSTVLPCPAVLSGSLSCLHLSSFSMNMVSTAAPQDAMVTTTTLGGQRVSICTCTRTGRHLATFTHRLGSILYTLATEPPQVAASAQESASGPVAPPCLCRLLSHQTLMWHHRLGHPSLPRPRSMHSRLLVSCLPRSLPPLPPSPALPCLPYVEGRQCAVPHSSLFPPTFSPLQTLRMDVWGPARVSGQGCERYFLLVVDDYTRYTMIFPLRSKGEVLDVLIPWIHIVHLQLCERFRADLPVLRVHSDRGAAQQLNLWPRVTLPETSPTLRWTGKVGDASVFRVWGSRAFVCDSSADKLSAHAIPCVFLGFPPDAPSWQFYYPTLRRVLPSQDIMFDESVPFYRLVPYRSAPPPPPLLFHAPGPPLLSTGAARGAASRGAATGGAEPGSVEPGGAESEDAGSGGAEPGGAELGGAEPVGVEFWGAELEGVEPGGAESGGAEPRGTASFGGPTGALPRLSPWPEPLSPKQLREWFTQRTRLRSRATGAGDSATGDTTAGGAGVSAGAGGTEGTAAAGPGGARTKGTGAVGPGAGAVGAGAKGTGAGGAGAGELELLTLELEVLELRVLCLVVQVLKALCGRERTSFPSFSRLLVSCLLLAFLLPYCVHRLTSRSRCYSQPHHCLLLLLTLSSQPIVSRLLATVVTNPSLESTAASALVAELVDFATACHLDYTTAIIAESESASPPFIVGEYALGTDVLEDWQEDFECHAAVVPCFASMLLPPEEDPDAPDNPTPRFYEEAITVPPSGANIVDGMWIFRGIDYFHNFSPTPKMTTLQVLLHVAAQRDYELHSLDFSTAFLQSSLYELMWLRRSSSFTGSFPAGTQWSLRRPVYGLRQMPREWHNTLRTTLASLGFPSSTADPSLFLRTDMTLPPFYVLVYIDDRIFVTADTEALTLVKSELWKRHTCTDLEPSGPYPELVGCLMYLMTCTRPDLAHPLSLLARYMAPGRLWDPAKRVLRYLCGMLGMGLVLGGRGLLVLTGHADASWVDDSAMQRSSQGYTVSLGSDSVSWRSSRSSSVLSSSCEVEIYEGAMAAQELRWLTYLRTNLGEQPRSPPVLYVDNKAMITLCQEHRLEHRTKHIALRYFLARELQQRGQLRLVYVATRANTADIFTKALLRSDHQRFSTVLGLVPTLPHLLAA